MQRFNLEAKNTKGFTLIELLIVISIISLLTSVIFSSLTTARIKAKDSAALQAMKQFEILLHLEFNETKSYSNLQPSIWHTAANCLTSFAGTYQAKARELCTNIVKNIPVSGSALYFPNYGTSYSISILNNKSLWTCLGTSGLSVDSGLTTSPGCFNNP